MVEDLDEPFILLEVISALHTDDLAANSTQSATCKQTQGNLEVVKGSSTNLLLAKSVE